MILDNPFEIAGNWYKGNLHIHTTESDGAKTPAEIAEHYRRSGYDFICITDHDKVADVHGLSSDDFVVIPGAEVKASGDDAGFGYDILALNVTEVEGSTSDANVNEVIRAIKAKGGEAVIAHPYLWGLTTNDLLLAQEYLGIEIFNTSCHFGVGKGCSTVLWDGLLARNRKVWGFAADDVHWLFNDHRPNDVCGGWIMVKAAELSREHIFQAIRKGRFYASSGPSIRNISVTEESVGVETSEVKVINFIADRFRGESFTSPDGKPMTSATYCRKGPEKYLRVECITFDGHTAWSNPLWIGERKQERKEDTTCSVL